MLGVIVKNNHILYMHQLRNCHWESNVHCKNKWRECPTLFKPNQNLRFVVCWYVFGEWPVLRKLGESWNCLQHLFIEAHECRNYKECSRLFIFLPFINPIKPTVFKYDSSGFWGKHICIPLDHQCIASHFMFWNYKPLIIKRAFLLTKTWYYWE